MKPQGSPGRGRARGGCSQGRQILFSTSSWRSIDLGSIDGADTEPGPSHKLKVDRLIDLESATKDRFIG